MNWLDSTLGDVVCVRYVFAVELGFMDNRVSLENKRVCEHM